MKATELVEKLKNVFLSEEVAQDEVKDVEVQSEVVSADSDFTLLHHGLAAFFWRTSITHYIINKIYS